MAPTFDDRGRRFAAARGTDNLMPRIIDAVKAMVTLGEISDALRAEWGTYRPA